MRLRDSEGKTALDYAQARGHAACEIMLREVGGEIWCDARCVVVGAVCGLGRGGKGMGRCDWCRRGWMRGRWMGVGGFLALMRVS